jgi:uncharacterized metal-binding protein YceD (DUF177 family)
LYLPGILATIPTFSMEIPSLVLSLPRKGRAVEEHLRLPWRGGVDLAARLAPETTDAEDRVLRLSGTLRFEVELECARCLAPVQLRIEKTFETRLDLLHNTSEALDLASGEEPATFRCLPEEQIDLSDEIASRLEQAIPDVVLCSADCKGLCPVCGANRNTEDCPHKT